MKEMLRSFAGGVITPEMFGRLDMTKYQTGLAKAENFVILPHGPAQNRAGTEYVLEVKDSTALTALLPFIYSTTDAAILEFGNQYMRVHVLGGTVLEPNVALTAISQAVGGIVTSAAHGYANGNTIFPTGVLGMVNVNNRPLKIDTVTANTYRLLDLAGNPLDTTGYPAYTGGGVTGRVFELATPYLTVDLFDLHFTQDSDVLTIAHPNYPQAELRRLGATNWTLSNIVFVPVAVQPPNAIATAAPASGTKKQRYMVTSVSTAGLEESLGVQPALNGGVAGVNITAATNANPGVFTAAAHGRAVGDNVTLVGVGGMLLATGVSGVNGLDLRIGTVPGANTFSLVNPDGSTVDTTALTAYTAGGQIFLTDITNDLTVVGNTNTIIWPAVPGTLRYNVYKNRNGIYGYIGQTNANSLVDQNITQNEAAAPPLLEDAFTGTGNWPQGVGYFQGRRWFAGTTLKKQNAWATVSGTESNMTYSLPGRDSDRLSFKIKSRQANAIRHIIPMNTLVFLTSSGEWRISASVGSTLTPSTIDPSPDAAVGSSNAQPIITNTTCLYSQDRGGRVRELQFSFADSGYVTNDKSIMTPQFFDNFTITQMAFQRAPNPFAWFVRNDGELLGFTYVPDQQINAWHSHNFGPNTFVESVAVIPEGKEDFLYLIVRRTLQGRTVRTIERLHTRVFTTLPDCYFTDCGFSYNGTAIQTVNFGLWHLEGELVSILGDGATHPPQVVTKGSVTLQAPCSKIAIGKQIIADLQTLPLALEIQAYGQGTTKNISKAYVRVANSSSLMIGPTFDKLRAVKQRTTENMGSPPNVMNDEEPINLDPQWNDNGQVCIRQDQPLPMTVLSMVLDAAVGG